MLLDVVSRNGNLMLNFPLPNSGMLDQQEVQILEEITEWMQVNGEAIYATRPWKISGAAPPELKKIGSETNFNEKSRKELTADDVRFTTKGNVLYAFVMGVPQENAVVASLASNGKQNVRKISRVELLGFPGKLEWAQDNAGLHVKRPQKKPCKHALAFKVQGAL